MNPLYAKWRKFAIRRTRLCFFCHLREDAFDLQGLLGAEADAEPKQLVDAVALLGREVLQGLADHARVGLHQGVPVVLQARKRLAPGPHQEGMEPVLSGLRFRMDVSLSMTCNSSAFSSPSTMETACSALTKSRRSFASYLSQL
jgi:hypothetical protein